jgi:hypothetical protein
MDTYEQEPEIRELRVEDVIGPRREGSPYPITGWVSKGRCPVDANMVHVEASPETGPTDVVRAEVVQGATPLAGMLVTPASFGPDQSVQLDHGCGVPATRVGPGESPVAVDDPNEV